MANIILSPERTRERIAAIESTVPKALVEGYEALAESLSSVCDIKDEAQVGTMFKSPAVYAQVVENMMAEVRPQLAAKYGWSEQPAFAVNENFDPVATTTAGLHERNIQTALETAGTYYRTQVNPHNLNMLTPFDGFIPHVIVRNYINQVLKDILPTVVSPDEFYRIRYEDKYIVTKTGNRYKRPDVYEQPELVDEILNTAKGAEVTQKWYPEVSVREGQVPDGLNLKNFDLLGESGGNRSIGDDLDIDVEVKAVRLVTDAGNEYEIEINAGYDLTSTTPKRSVSAEVGPIELDGQTYTDKLFGTYDAARKTWELISQNGYIKQVQFGGHLSNKNNLEYITYGSEPDVKTFGIPEGYTGNVPITMEDMQLFRSTAKIDIVANAINEFTEIMTNLEDNKGIKTIGDEVKKALDLQLQGIRQTRYKNFENKKLVFRREVNLQYQPHSLLKRYETKHDMLNEAIENLIADIRAEYTITPFTIKFFTHPNIAAIIGSGIDWKTSQASMRDEITEIHKVGVITSGGNQFEITSSFKFKEEDGLQFVILPVNEANFLSWKHYKHAIVFSHDYRISEMSNVPNVRCLSRFFTKAITPTGGSLLVKGARDASLDNPVEPETRR